MGRHLRPSTARHPVAPQPREVWRETCHLTHKGLSAGCKQVPGLSAWDLPYILQRTRSIEEEEEVLRCDLHICVVWCVCMQGVFISCIPLAVSITSSPELEKVFSYVFVICIRWQQFSPMKSDKSVDKTFLYWCLETQHTHYYIGLIHRVDHDTKAKKVQLSTKQGKDSYWNCIRLT